MPAGQVGVLGAVVRLQGGGAGGADPVHVGQVTVAVVRVGDGAAGGVGQGGDVAAGPGQRVGAAGRVGDRGQLTGAVVGQAGLIARGWPCCRPGR